MGHSIYIYILQYVLEQRSLWPCMPAWGQRVELRMSTQKVRLNCKHWRIISDRDSSCLIDRMLAAVASGGSLSCNLATPGAPSSILAPSSKVRSP